MKIGFIGAGRVGTSLGTYLIENGQCVTGYYSRSSDSAASAAAFTDTKAYDDIAMLINDSDVIFITVPDSVITQVYRQLAGYGINGKVLCHCSGAMTADEAFPEISSYGAAGLSIHPALAVSSRTESYKELAGAFFCIEGDEKNCDIWRDLLSSMGNTVKLIDSGSKTKYHAACSIASNLVCMLIDESVGLLGECGFSEEEALSALRPLASANMEKVLSAGAVKALTGPVERNDTGTVEKHINCISDKVSRDMYKAAALRLVQTAGRKNPGTDYSAMTEMLSRKEE